MTVTPARRRLVVIAASAATALAVMVVPAARGDATEPGTAAAASTQLVASATVSPAGRATAAERVARRFLDAYGGFEANRALKLLTKDAIATGSGNTGNSWGSRDAFRGEVALAQAWHVKQTVTNCENQGHSGKGVTVRCTFDYHALRSDEIGRGPFRDNHWDLVVRAGKITSAVSTWAYITNGFSVQMWQPFQAWVSSAHPEDLQALYPVGEPTPAQETIRRWDVRTREWVASMKASSR